MTNERQFERKCWFVFACCLAASGAMTDVRIARAHASGSQFQPSPCPDVVQGSIESSGLSDIECGFVEVPEDYRKPCTRDQALRVFVVISHTRAAHPKTPVFFLTGGPGQALSGIVGEVFSTGVTGRLRAQRDVVLIDPRGVGFSEPRLSCPPPAPPAPAAPSGSALTPPQQDAVRCADAMVAQGVDLADYNTRTLARDVERVRSALRLPKVVLYGVSYGAFLGLQTLRHARNWVESAVLVSIPRPEGGTLVRSGPAMQGAIDAFGRMCAAQPACAAYGDFAANLAALVAQLIVQPIDLGVSSAGVPMQLTVDLLGIFLQQAFSFPENASTLPKAIASALRGEPELWVPVVEEFLAQPPIDRTLFSSEPVHNSVWCSEDLVLGSPEEVERRAEGTSELVRRTAVPAARMGFETCAVWPVPEAPRSFFAPFVTDIPTYLISGALDPITPPEYARRGLRYLSNGQVTIVAAAGHLASENSPCAPELVERFLDAPYEPVDDSCTNAPVQFVP